MGVSIFESEDEDDQAEPPSDDDPFDTVLVSIIPGTGLAFNLSSSTECIFFDSRLDHSQPCSS